jgi:hypothetical protein
VVVRCGCGKRKKWAAGDMKVSYVPGRFCPVVEQPIVVRECGELMHTRLRRRRVGGGPEVSLVTMAYLSRGPGTCSYDTRAILSSGWII